MSSTSVLVPLYIYPLEESISGTWAPLIDAIRSHPNLNFVVVINPNSGPDGRPFLPDEQYQRAVPYLQDYPNVRLVGYIKTLYGKRDIENVKHDVDLYSHWHNLSKTKKTGPMGLDGIFVDEVDWAGEYSNYMEVPLSGLYLMYGYVVLNPGCAITHAPYYNMADLVVVFEHYYFDLIYPPIESPDFQYLTNVAPNHGLKLMLPKPSRQSPPSKFGVMLHDFLPGGSHHAKLVEMRSLIHDLVQVKRVGAVFITDVQIKKADVYANWSPVWNEFISMMAEANKSSSL